MPTEPTADRTRAMDCRDETTWMRSCEIWERQGRTGNPPITGLRQSASSGPRRNRPHRNTPRQRGGPFLQDIIRQDQVLRRVPARVGSCLRWVRVLNLGRWRDAEIVQLSSNLCHRAFQLKANYRDGDAFPGKGDKGLHSLVGPVGSSNIHGKGLHAREPQVSIPSKARS